MDMNVMRYTAYSEMAIQVTRFSGKKALPTNNVGRVWEKKYKENAYKSSALHHHAND